MLSPRADAGLRGATDRLVRPGDVPLQLCPLHPPLPLAADLRRPHRPVPDQRLHLRAGHVQLLRDLLQRQEPSTGTRSVSVDNAQEDADLGIELIQNVRPTNIPSVFFSALDQRLFNMLAAATALVDHTRALIDKGYAGTEFADEFKSRNAGVRDAPGSKFLRDLRNYVSHKGVLNLGFRLTLTPDGTASGTIFLTPAELRAWDKWSSTSRAYIDAAGTQLDLGQCVLEFRSAMQDLYDWILSRFDGIHGPQIRGADQLARQLNLASTDGESDGSDSAEFCSRLTQAASQWLETHRAKESPVTDNTDSA